MSASSRVTAVVATATVSTFSAVNLERTYRRGIVKSAYSGQLIGVGMSGLKTRKRMKVYDKKILRDLECLIYRLHLRIYCVGDYTHHIVVTDPSPLRLSLQTGE